jgi:hypothetical protein
MMSGSCQQCRALASTFGADQVEKIGRTDMWRRFEGLIQKIETLRYRWAVERALALHSRGEARRDGLKLTKLTNRLEIEWRARDVHPWDRDDPPERRALRYVRQSLSDTEAAIERLFQNLPQLDVISVTVLEHDSDTVIMTGTVYRGEPEPAAELSAGMRLWKRGVKYHSDGWVFEPLGSGVALE